MTHCIAAGCSTNALFGTLCRTHADRRSKHGHPTVTPIDRREVRPFADVVRQEMNRTGVKKDIDAYFAKMKEEQQAIVDDMNATGVGMLDRYYAAIDFVDATGDGTDQVLVDLLCLGWYIQLNDKRFPNQESIAIASARALRWSLHKGTVRTLRKTGAIDVSKRYLKASALRHLGSTLVPTLVSFGYAMAKTWREREVEKTELKHNIMQTITKGEAA